MLSKSEDGKRCVKKTDKCLRLCLTNTYNVVCTLKLAIQCPINCVVSSLIQQGLELRRFWFFEKQCIMKQPSCLMQRCLVKSTQNLCKFQDNSGKNPWIWKTRISKNFGLKLKPRILEVHFPRSLVSQNLAAVNNYQSHALRSRGYYSVAFEK